MYLCPGCRLAREAHGPHEKGGQEIVACPRRGVCAWYAPDAASFKHAAANKAKVIKPRFKTKPYFECPDFTMVPPTDDAPRSA
jgi:hypothetical protein